MKRNMVQEAYEQEMALAKAHAAKAKQGTKKSR